MGVAGQLGDINDGGGYDLSEIKRANEAMGNKVGDEQGFEEVEPMTIEVSSGPSVRVEEFEARSVMIEYDAYDNIVRVELL